MSTADYLKLTFSDVQTPINAKPHLPFASSPLYNSKIIDARQLTSGSDVKRTYDIVLDVQDIDHDFQPGDTIGIIPENNQDEIKLLIERLHLTQYSYHLEILENTSKKNASIPPHIPRQGSLLELFKKHVDIRSPPKKLFLKTLLRFAKDQNEINKLQQISAPGASTEYIHFIETHSSLLHVLNAFPSCQPPLERILEHVGPLKPRPYSIASSSLTKELRIVFSVIDNGVCSSWLEKTISSTDKRLSFYFRCSNKFRLPQDPSTSIIMIGPGTGVAPFIGFLQHRKLLKLTSKANLGNSWLFYGCRYLHRDFLFQTEIEEFLEDGVLTKFFNCSSRDGPNKTYVQHLIKERSKSFVDELINNDAIVYVCGDARNMVKDVKETVMSCLVECKSWSQSEVTDFMKQLQANGRYIEDSWL